jgi:Fe-S cluster assembly protein SufD
VASPRLDLSAVPAELRERAAAAYPALPAPGPQPGRYWKIDLAKLDLEALVPFNGEERELVQIQGSGQARAVTFAQALADGELRALFERSLGSVADVTREKLAALTVAKARGGAFIYIPPNVALEEPILVTYNAGEAAIFPYTLIVAGRGSSCSVIERTVAHGAEPFSCALVEIVAAEDSTVRYASLTEPVSSGRSLATRRGRAADGATIAWSLAELGTALVVDSVRTLLAGEGSSTEIAALFFADESQHVAIESLADHDVGSTNSQTVIKGGATGHGQGHYVGNIRIHPRAHLSDATMRDDSLLLSKDAHIESIPALEIAANDVKAYHGATVGAISEDEIFYAQSRGIPRADAERLIALGFFEPAVVHFPESLREEIRAALAQKIAVSL